MNPCTCRVPLKYLLVLLDTASRNCCHFFVIFCCVLYMYVHESTFLCSYVFNNVHVHIIHVDVALLCPDCGISLELWQEPFCLQLQGNIQQQWMDSVWSYEGAEEISKGFTCIMCYCRETNEVMRYMYMYMYVACIMYLQYVIRAQRTNLGHIPWEKFTLVSTLTATCTWDYSSISD